MTVTAFLGLNPSMIKEVARSVIKIIIMVNNTFSNGNTNKNEKTTNPSKTKIHCDVLISKYLFNILAITDVPPMTTPAAMTKPMPTPTNTTPNEAVMTEYSIHVLKYYVKYKKIEIAVYTIKV